MGQLSNPTVVMTVALVSEDADALQALVFVTEPRIGAGSKKNWESRQ